MWIRVHSGPWIRIQWYKIKGFSALELLKSGPRNKLKEDTIAYNLLMRSDL